ncbi:toll/interleukin-1 receptor domain-containing protein [Pareuzebyella sediminis]|uniref:toll/interleukin-1 receptor domain-containing protein n=1 Tax=Pareuzebyella sediminis TaxID=2607998 RepID=UPI0011EE4840|nr:toll/interleukin-1 receptor domain-containing protein [Pareuzebyella sediminis]
MHLFFSYSRQQEAEIKDLVDFLSIYHNCWFDSNIGAGNEWWKEILSQIRNCDVFVFLLSKDSNISKACKAELGYAEALNKHMVILQVEEINMSFILPVLKDNNITPYLPSDQGRKNSLLRNLKQIEDSKIYVRENTDYDAIPEPKIPMSEISMIHTEVKSDRKLSIEEQRKILFQIERLVEKKTEKFDNIQAILKEFLNRDDINYQIGKKIDALISTAEPNSKENLNMPDTNYDSGAMNDVLSMVEIAVGDKSIRQRLQDEIHNPNFIFGKWKRVLSVQNNQSLPINVEEYLIFNNNYSFQLIQNGMQITYGGFSYNAEFLTINFINGMIDTRSFRCFKQELFIVQYMNYLPFNVDCYQRMG